MRFLKEKMSDQKLNEFLTALNIKTGMTEIYHDVDKKSGCDLVITYHKNEDMFMYVLDGGKKRHQRKLLKKALNYLENDICMYVPNKLTLDDIYDIDSLTSASNLFELCKKMQLVLDAVLN